MPRNSSTNTMYSDGSQHQKWNWKWHGQQLDHNYPGYKKINKKQQWWQWVILCNVWFGAILQPALQDPETTDVFGGTFTFKVIMDKHKEASKETSSIKEELNLNKQRIDEMENKVCSWNRKQQS